MMSDDSITFVKQLYYFGPSSGLMMDLASRLGAKESEVEYINKTRIRLIFTFDIRLNPIGSFNRGTIETTERSVQYELTEEKASELNRSIQLIADEVVEDIKRLCTSQCIIPVKMEGKWHPQPKKIDSFDYKRGDAAKQREVTDEEIKSVLIGGVRKMEV